MKVRKKIASVLYGGPVQKFLEKELEKFKPTISFHNEKSEIHDFVINIIAEGEDYKVMAVDCFAIGFMTAVKAFQDKKLL